MRASHNPFVSQQLFVLYVRLAAKRKGDSTKVDTRNPAMDILTKQLQLDGGAQEMAKKLASKFLSSETTVMEYDLKQAADMQGGVLVNMAFMWFLHFKMEKVQPLLIQVVMGFLQLIYSPLFQVYVSKLESMDKVTSLPSHKHSGSRKES